MFVKVLLVIAEAKLAPTIRLSSGYEMPIIGFGTYQVTYFLKSKYY